MESHVDRISTNIRKGVLEYCVLALLSKRDMYGLELANELVERGLSASEGSLYPLLARMREAGAVETRWEQSSAAAGSRARRYYTLTEHGRELLVTFGSVWSGIAGAVNELLSGKVGLGATEAEETQ